MSGKRLVYSCILVIVILASASCGEDYNPCISGSHLCGMKCVDFLTDDDNCGKCGNVCGIHSDCYSGVCNCVAGFADCDGEQGNSCEVDTSSDPENCGECGNTCGLFSECIQGHCKCFEGYFDCFGSCVNPDVDHDHCGVCSAPCQIGWFCISGACKNECPQPLTVCGDQCIDVTSDIFHCGSCDYRCRRDQVCSSGTCGCSENKIECEGICVDISSDRDNCGRCGSDCSLGSACTNSVCTKCQIGFTPCLDEDGVDRCVDLMTENCHCGECNNKCLCDYGQCIPDCGGDHNLMICGPDSPCISGESEAGCKDLSSDPMHCGGCNNICATGESCEGGVCQ